MFHDVETDRVIINVFNCPALYDDVKVKFLSPVSNQDTPFFCLVFSLFWFFETELHSTDRLEAYHTTQVGLEDVVLLPQPPKC